MPCRRAGGRLATDRLGRVRCVGVRWPVRARTGRFDPARSDDDEGSWLASAEAAAVVASLQFDAAGLVPAVVQDHDSREVLMVAWMSPEAVTATLAEGRTVFWSRSRRELWRKGETSGHVQHVRDLRVDCDADTLLVTVDQDGAACHTGERTCFHRTADDLAGTAVAPDVVTGGAAS